MKLLARELPQFRFYNPAADTYVGGWARTWRGYNNYELGVYLGYMYPDEVPKMYVYSPRLLPKRGGCGTINSEGISHCFHTSGNGPGGCVQICHFRPESWDPSKTVVAVLVKGLIWLDAYEEYLATGKLISQYCDELMNRC
jgi:hypothetical protein